MNDNTPPGKRLGKGMLVLSWVLVLGALTAFFGNWEKARYNPNQSPEGSIDKLQRSLTLERNAYNHYVLTGQINGRDVVFLLDTGASDVSIPARLGRELGLKPGAQFSAMTANGIVQVRSTRIDQLQLGPIQLHNVRASLNPGMTGKEVLLGMSALKTLDFVQSGTTLTLTQTLGN